MSARRRRSGHFNPRPPRGGRRQFCLSRCARFYFNPRPPRGGRHLRLHVQQIHKTISIHAPREGGDPSTTFKEVLLWHFNPRPPRGGRHHFEQVYSDNWWISIHAPREGGDSKDAQFYLRIFDKSVEFLRFFWGKTRGGCPRKPGKDRRFLGKSLANLQTITGHLDFARGGKARPGCPCAVPPPCRETCVRGSGDPPAGRCSSHRNAPLFSRIASPDSKSADCPSRDP